MVFYQVFGELDGRQSTFHYLPSENHAAPPVFQVAFGAGSVAIFLTGAWIKNKY